MASKYNFESKVALVTGSSSGIGEACAIQLAQYGARVTITGRNAEALARVAAEIEKVSGHQPVQVIGDLSSDTELPRKLIDETIAKFGRLDVLVNNAGTGTAIKSLFEPKIMEAYYEVFGLNVRSVLNLTRLAVPHLEKTKGNIVNISSIASLRPFSCVYSMSKAAVDMLTKTAAQELGPKGIRVNSVNPGPIKTNFFRSTGMKDVSEEKKTEMFQGLLDRCTLQRVPLASDIANLVSFLASSNAANITGSIMVSDTGMLVKSPK